MRIRLPEDEGDKLEELTKAARLRTGRAISASAWLRGAVRIAACDEGVADRIADAAPETGHGGPRPGAGRPRTPEGGNAADMR